MQTDSFNIGVIQPVECMKEGWEMIKADYWLFFGITIVGLLLAGAIPIVLIGPLLCGIYYCMLKRHDGGKVEFGDLAKGFDFFVPSLIAILIIAGFFLVVGGVIIVIPMMLAMVATAAGSPEAGLFFMVIMCIVIFIFGIVAACAHVLILFTHLLIIDRKLDGWQAVKLSAKAGWQNLNGVVGFILVQFGLVLVGYLLCIVGAYLTLPILYAGTTVVYRKVFPRFDGAPDYSVPPSPANYPAAGFNPPV